MTFILVFVSSSAASYIWDSYTLKRAQLEPNIDGLICHVASDRRVGRRGTSQLAMSQAKILFLAANTIASHVVLTPPNATPMPGERANFKVNVGNTRTKLLDLIVSIATLAKV